MNKLSTLLTVLLVLQIFNIYGQEKYMPYYATGFDSISEQTGWVQHRIGAQRLYEWSYVSDQYASSSYSLHHGFMTHHIIPDTVKDWFVSPPINMLDGANLAVKINGLAFSQDSSTNPLLDPSCYFGIWYSASSPDPNSGTYSELVDLTSFSMAGSFKDTSHITIPPLSDSSYVAFVYRNINSVYNIYIDDLIISKLLTGINNDDLSNGQVSIFPNPCSDYALVDLQAFEGFSKMNLQVYNATGQLIRTEKIDTKMHRFNRESLQNGVYFIRIVDNGAPITTQKLIIQ